MVTKLLKESKINLEEKDGKVKGEFTLVKNKYSGGYVSIIKNSVTGETSVVVKSWSVMGDPVTYYRGSSLKGLFSSLYKVKTDSYGEKMSIIKADGSDYYLAEDESQFPDGWRESLEQLYKEVKDYEFKSSNDDLRSSDYSSTEDLLKDIVPQGFNGYLEKQDGNNVTYFIEGLDEDRTDHLLEVLESTLKSKGFSFEYSADYSSVWARGKYVVDIWSQSGEFAISVSEEHDDSDIETVNEFLDVNADVDVPINLDASGSSVGFLGGTAGQAGSHKESLEEGKFEGYESEIIDACNKAGVKVDSVTEEEAGVVEVGRNKGTFTDDEFDLVWRNIHSPALDDGDIIKDGKVMRFTFTESSEDEYEESLTESADIDDSIKEAHDALTAAGFSRDKISPFGVEVAKDEICYSKDIDDLLAQIIYDKEWFDGKPGYILQFLGEEEDSIMANKNPLSLRSAIKIAKLAEKYFDEYPATAKFMEKFADEYGLQFGI